MKIDPYELPEAVRESLARRVRETLGAHSMKALKTVEENYGPTFASVCGADVYLAALAACIVAVDFENTGLERAICAALVDTCARQRTAVAAAAATLVAKAEAEAAINKAAGGTQ